MSAVTLQSEQSWQLGGYFAAASWGANVWDGLIRFDDEVAFIWPMPPTAYIKWLYFFGKYIALGVQTMLLVIQVGHANQPVPLQFCRVYRPIEMVVTILLVICFDTVLMLRIYALYGRRTWSRALAACAVLVEWGTSVAFVASTIPVVMYDAACVMTPVPKSVFSYIIGTSVSQTVLLWLSFRKRQHVVRGRPSVACVTIRDGMLAFVCMSVYLVIVFVCELRDNSVTSLMILWLPMICSVATCRIILNLQRVAHVASPHELTTEIRGLDGDTDSYLLADVQSRSRSS